MSIRKEENKNIYVTNLILKVISNNNIPYEDRKSFLKEIRNIFNGEYVENDNKKQKENKKNELSFKRVNKNENGKYQLISSNKETNKRITCKVCKRDFAARFFFQHATRCFGNKNEANSSTRYIFIIIRNCSKVFSYAESSSDFSEDIRIRSSNGTKN